MCSPPSSPAKQYITSSMTSLDSSPLLKRPVSRLCRDVLFTNCSGVMYSSLQVGIGLFSSLKTADTSVRVCWELMKEAGMSADTRAVTCHCTSGSCLMQGGQHFVVMVFPCSRNTSW